MMKNMVKESGKRSSIVLPCLLGLTVAYQMAFQFIVWQKALPAADELESPIQCWGEQKEKQGKHKALAGQCAEVELFESWQTSEEITSLQRDEETDWFTPDLISVGQNGHIQLRELENHGFGTGTSEPLRKITDSAKPLADDQGKITAKGLTDTPDAMESPDAVAKVEAVNALEQVGFHMGGLKAAGFSSVNASESEVAEYGMPKREHDLVQLGFHLNELKASGFSTIHFRGVISPQWKTDMQALQNRVHKGMKHLKVLHNDTLSDHAAGTDKPELLDKIEALQKELCADHIRQGHPECAHLLNSQVANSTDDAPKQVLLMGQMASVTHKRIKWTPPNSSQHIAHPMMKSSEWIASLSAAQTQMEAQYRKARRGRGTMKERKEMIRSKRDAKDMKKHVDELNDGLAKIGHQRAVWESSLEARTMAIGVQMCSEESRKGNPACEYFLHPHGQHGNLKNTTVVSADSNGQEYLILPTSGAGWKHKNTKFLEKRVRRQRLMLKREDLLAKHWKGKIPKVACIMSIPTINDTSKEPWLHHAVTTAVNAFRAEKYEGPKQLVIVHHRDDLMAKRIANRLADGVYVKAVAAHLPVPSTMALRYAAWSSDKDADVVARWDLNAYHHPERLSMQVRALGLSGRPVSAAMWGVTFSENGKRSVLGEESGLENSMVGIRSWMDLHWHPYVENMNGPLAKVSDLVTLDMPELTKAPEKKHDEVTLIYQ
jgi:hypothetical protein